MITESGRGNKISEHKAQNTQSTDLTGENQVHAGLITSLKSFHEDE